MDKSRVAVVRCGSYDEDQIFEAVSEGVRLLGGTERFAALGERVLLKPNVLAGDPPERAVCTHPAVLKAAARLLRGQSRRLRYGDSPGAGKAAPHLRRARLEPAAAEVGLEQAEFDRGREVPFAASPFPAVDRFLLAEGVLEADCLVSLSKMKTHNLVRMTGAVKNLYGCVPGLQKKALHLRFPDAFGFSRMLVALNLRLRARLHIMDAVVAMQGNGPRGGDPAPVGLLLFSADPVALDAVMCRLVDLDPLNVPTTRPGREWGLGTYLEDEIELVGDPPAAQSGADFKVPRGPVGDSSASGAMGFINNLISRRPAIQRRRCRLCGECVAACPVRPQALSWPDRTAPPVFSYSRCIRCWCCQEICPEGAIQAKRSVLKV